MPSTARLEVGDIEALPLVAEPFRLCGRKSAIGDRSGASRERSRPSKLAICSTKPIWPNTATRFGVPCSAIRMRRGHM